MNHIQNTKSVLQDSFILSLVALLAFMSFFVAFEPAVGLAVEDQVVVNQTVTSGITISSPSDVTMSRPLTVTDHTAVGTSTWTVATNNVTGYTMSISASSTAACPLNAGGVRDALCDVSTGNAFADQATTSKATWSVSSAYEFGYSAFGSNTTGHGTASPASQCSSSADTPNTGLLYQGLDGTKLIQIASSSSATTIAGTATSVCFAVEQDTVYAPSGAYQATTTATAVVQ